MSRANMGQMYAGDTYRCDFAIQTSTGAAQDLTGCAVNWYLSRPTALESPVLTKSIGSGITVTNAASGLVRLELTKGTLKDPGLYSYELECILSSGESYTQASGLFRVLPAIKASA